MIHVPPAPALQRLVRLVVVGVFAGLAVLSAAVGLARFTSTGRFSVPCLVGAGAGLAAAAIATLLFRSESRRCLERRRRFFASLPAGQPQQLTGLLDTIWDGYRWGSLPDQVREVLRHYSMAEPAARVVCLGKVGVPEIGEFYFEPEIITPTRFFGRQLFFVPVAAAVIAFWLLQVTGVIPGRAVSPGGFGYIVVMGIGAAVAWFWRSTIRPTYIRMAPGVIQILEFGYRKKKPAIRSYPMDAETIVFVQGPMTGRKPMVRTLTLMRHGRKDTIPLERMRDRDKAIERAWQALLSTAPAPPLSDEELVG